MKVFITGGSAGIGLALVENYLSQGHDVGLCARDLSRLPGPLKEHPKLKAYEVSVTDLEALKKAVADFCQGQLDIMIANAGVSVGSKKTLPQFEDAKRLVDINVQGLLNSFSVALDFMLPHKKGQLVALASVAGMVGLPGAGPYSASKAFVLKLCESFQLDLKQYGIAVTAIAPGFIDTPLTRKNDHSMPFLMPASKASDLMVKAIAKKKALYIFPWQMKILITFLALIPRFLYRAIMSMPVANYTKN